MAMTVLAGEAVLPKIILPTWSIVSTVKGRNLLLWRNFFFRVYPFSKGDCKTEPERGRLKSCHPL